MIGKGLKFGIVLLLAAMFFVASCEFIKSKPPEKEVEKEDAVVLARLENGDVITWKELDSVYHVERMRKRLTEEQVTRLLDNLVRERLIYLDGLEKGYDKDPEYVRQIERQKRKLINSIAMRKLSRQDVEITDEDMKEYYDAHPQAFHILKIEYIMFSPRKFNNNREKATSEAKKALDAIRKGMSFKEAAKKYLNRSRPFKINLREGQHSFFGKNFENVVWKLGVGKTSDLIDTSQGVLVVKVVEDVTQSLDEAKSYLKSILKRERSTNQVKEYYDSLEAKYGVQIDEKTLRAKLEEMRQSPAPAPSRPGVPPTPRPSAGARTPR